MGAMVALSARITAPIALIVEDDETVREVVGRVLESEGYVTHEASNGVEGLEQYYVTLPDPDIAGREDAGYGWVGDAGEGTPGL